MSSFDHIYKKMISEPETCPLAPLQPPSLQPEPPRQIAREVAHELNNIFTVLQGTADIMLLSHQNDPVLHSKLQQISENVRRAVAVVRKASRNGEPNLLIR